MMKIKARLMWPSLNETTGPNPMSNKYEVDLYDVAEADHKKLVQAGVQPKQHKETKETYFKAKSNKPVLVVDRSRTPLTSVAVGNDSLAIVAVEPYEWTYQSKKGINLGFSAVQILELKERGGVTPDMFDDLGDDSQEIPF